MIEALLWLVVGLMVVKLTAVWMIWRRMDRFADQLDYIEDSVAESRADADELEKSLKVSEDAI